MKKYACLIYPDEATRLASNIPMAMVGTIEVRPVVHIERVDMDD
jgi:hypothetical protein